MSDNRMSVSDPQRIRALSHPLRLELIDIVSQGPATATQCTLVTGASVASCSFHLRMLAKYGYIEPAERIGRERPWQLTAASEEFRPDVNDPASRRAVAAMASVFLDREVENIHRWLAEAATASPEWIAASVVTGTSVWATADEAIELGAILKSFVERFDNRRTDANARPAGSELVRIFSAVHLDVARAAGASRRSE